MRRFFLFTLIIVTVLLLFTLALAETGTFQVPWHSVAGGGGTSGDGGRFTVAGAIGQADAGQVDGGSRFQLSGGFIGGLPGQDVDWTVYLPMVVRP